MKVGAVNSSQLAAHNRWDAKFHLALAKVQERVAELKQAYPKPEELVDRMKILKTNDLQSIALLRRRRSAFGKAGRHELLQLMRMYPYVSFALIEPVLAEIAANAIVEIRNNYDYLAAVEALRKL